MRDECGTNAGRDWPEGIAQLFSIHCGRPSDSGLKCLLREAGLLLNRSAGLRKRMSMGLLQASADRIQKDPDGSRPPTRSNDARSPTRPGSGARSLAPHPRADPSRALRVSQRSVSPREWPDGGHKRRYGLGDRLPHSLPQGPDTQAGRHSPRRAGEIGVLDVRGVPGSLPAAGGGGPRVARRGGPHQGGSVPGAQVPGGVRL